VDRFTSTSRKEEVDRMSRTMVVLLALLVGLTVPGLAVAGGDSEAVLAREEDVADLVAEDDDADDGQTDTDTGNTGNTGNTQSKDSLDTTADRSRSRDRSGDKTGGGKGADRSNSLDRSRDNTADHSRGTTTND
jgi:hypothetical protein